MVRSILISALVLAGLTGWARGQSDADRVCVINATGETHLFAVETREGARDLAVLDAGARLCSQPTASADGVVSIYESRDAVEGCSRIVPRGRAEPVLTYAEFDRCRWGSHGASAPPITPSGG